jgi:hypothetical protein
LKVLLDENFPLALYHALVADGEQVEHIIALGLRGTSDQHIRERLFDKDMLFLTQDEDFLFDEPTEATVVLSRARQSRPLAERVGVWHRTVVDLLRHPKPERWFELMDDASCWPGRPGRKGRRTPEGRGSQGLAPPLERGAPHAPGYPCSRPQRRA